ncbi:MAG: outer membrane protein assembly factor BamB family protein [Planctomycetota bacterium]
MASATFLGLIGPCYAEEASADAAWHVWRGNAQLHGVSGATIPDEPQLLWTFETTGPVMSSAVIGRGKVYVGSFESKLYALDAKTGKVIWAYETGDMIDAPPTLHGGRVYVGSADGLLYCLDADKGELIWKYETWDKINGAAIVLRRPKTGKEMVLVGSDDMLLHCVDAETGEKVWEYETDNYIRGTPGVADGKTVFAGCDELLHVINVDNGESTMDVPIGGYVTASAAMDGSKVFVGTHSNEMVCIDIGEGAIAWKHVGRGTFPIESSPALTDKYVLYGAGDKRLHCLDRATGEEVWDFASRSRMNSSPVVVGNRVLIGSNDGRLYMVNLTDGEEVWRYETGDGISSSPAVAGGMIVVGSDDGLVYAFGAKAD